MNSNTNHELRSNLLGSTCNLSDKTHLLPFYNLNSYNSIQFVWVLWCSYFPKCKRLMLPKRGESVPCMTQPDTSAVQNAKEHLRAQLLSIPQCKAHNQLTSCFHTALRTGNRLMQWTGSKPLNEL